MIIEGNVLTAENGMVLTNGETFTEQVHLGIYDSPDNWHEVPPEDMEEVPDDEALSILLGGAV